MMDQAMISLINNNGTWQVNTSIGVKGLEEHIDDQIYEALAWMYMW